MRPLLVCWLLFLLFLLPDVSAQSAEPCDDECVQQQIVNCGQIPLSTPRERALFQRQYRECLVIHGKVKRRGPRLRAIVQSRTGTTTTRVIVPRADLNGLYAPSLAWSYENRTGCPAQQTISMPVFGPNKAVSVSSLAIPILTRAHIRKVEAAALAALAASASTAAIASEAAASTTVSAASQFVHPAAGPGPAELAWVRWQLANGQEPQQGAWTSMLTGANVGTKSYGNWTVPTDCPLTWTGPYAAARIDVRYGGLTSSTALCPDNFPPAASVTNARNLCGHIAFVELDAQQVYKQAIAFRATNNTAYADNVLAIVADWTATNKFWGVRNQNGPLEAGWGLAAMARSLELLRGHPSFEASRASLNAWAALSPLPDMDHFINVQTTNAVGRNIANFQNNWHTTIAEAYMALALLNDNTAMYARAVGIFQAAVGDYLRWGRNPAFSANRVVGECSETLRDIYHSEFAFGSIAMMAEMAWKQGDDSLYRFGGAALASALELHARIINAALAGNVESELPGAAFKWQRQMPAPPAGCEWAFDMAKQLWFARSRTNGTRYNDLLDGNKYVVGPWFVPTNWDVAYNHYAGRLGLPMPETQRLLVRYPVEWFEFHWGLGTLTHASSALMLWRNGLGPTTVCD